jgi:hypothetical protein
MSGGVGASTGRPPPAGAARGDERKALVLGAQALLGALAQPRPRGADSEGVAGGH